MGLRLKIAAFVVGLIFFAVVLRCIQRNTFRPRYAVLWLSMSLFLISVSVLEPGYKWISTYVFGFADARHIIYIALIGFLLVYNLYLTAMASRMSNQIQHLISTVAILENREGRTNTDPSVKPASDTPPPRPTA